MSVALPVLTSSPVLSLEGVSKRFGGVQAVSGVSIDIHPGERVAVVGHNGAGKSTLMNMILGVVSPDAGTIRIEGLAASGRHDVASAFAAGIRCVFQELSLCGNLTAAENLALQNEGIRRLNWRARSRELIREALDRTFPGHGLDLDRPMAEMPIGARQMVEISRAFAEVDRAVRLIVLDEPTSSLDARASEQLLAAVRLASSRGVASIFISHRLREVLTLVDRVVVMRDGRIVADAPAESLSYDRLVGLMGEGARSGRISGRVLPSSAVTRRPQIQVSRRGRPQPDLELRGGEIVGLAGLDGHGQRDLLRRVFLRRPRPEETIDVAGSLAYVSGDRQREGVFPLWSVGGNITIGLIRILARFGLLSPRAERAAAGSWRDRLAIRTPDLGQSILSLSGGNQQKVLIARAFASTATSILLDDPMRGVDVDTKTELYGQIRAEASGGRSFLWYTTEIEELQVCDRIYVFYEGAVTDAFDRADLDEDRVLRASFASETQHA